MSESTELIPFGSGDMESALCASFESQERQGWLHTEIDLWLWGGEERKPAVSKRLIEDHAEEFQVYGRLVTSQVTNYRPQGGRPPIIYILNFEQALLYCARSEAPRAAQVRKALIRTFMKYISGELVPTSSDAVIQSAGWDRMTQALTDLALTVNQGFSSVGRDLGEVRQDVSLLRTEVGHVRERVAEIEASKRKDPKPADVALLAKVTFERNHGMCPCCGDVRIVDESGNRTEFWTVDHVSGHYDNRIEHLWPICQKCNQRLYSEAGFRQQVQAEFAVFQKHVGRMRPEQMRFVM